MSMGVDVEFRAGIALTHHATPISIPSNPPQTPTAVRFPSATHQTGG